MSPAISRPLRAGTRGSPLALRQTGAVLDLLRPAWPAEPRIIRTSGDAVQDRPLAEIGGKGLFAKEIHEALADGRIDFAVHSLKDLETVLPDGIVLAAVLPREDARDVLILRSGLAPADPAQPFAALPTGAAVGTASVRRQAQLLAARPDLRPAMLRGNVETRLAKLAAGACDATLLAAAGLRRLGLAPEGALALDPELVVPAAGQGIIGITARSGDDHVRALLAKIEDDSARIAAEAERALLAALGGSCRTPIGAHARLAAPDRLRLTGLVARPDGSFSLKQAIEGPPPDAARLGTELGRGLKAASPDALFA